MLCLLQNLRMELEHFTFQTSFYFVTRFESELSQYHFSTKWADGLFWIGCEELPLCATSENIDPILPFSFLRGTSGPRECDFNPLGLVFVWPRAFESKRHWVSPITLQLNYGSIEWKRILTHFQPHIRLTFNFCKSAKTLALLSHLNREGSLAIAYFRYIEAKYFPWT